MGQKKTNESMFGDMARLSSNVVRDVERNRTNVGTSLASRARAWAGSWKSGRTTKDQVAANKFIDKFTSRGIEALRMAVSSNLVNPNSNQLSAAPAPAPAPTPSPPSGPPPNPPSGPPPSGPQANAAQNYPNMNVNVRAPAQTGLNVRMPNVQTQQTPGSTQPQTTTGTTTQNNRPQQTRQANRPQQNVPPPRRGRKGRRGRFRESVQYQNLNKLFEEYLFLLEQTDTTNNPQPAQPAQPAQPELPSISEYFKEQFLDLYLDGITPQQMRYAQPKINQILTNLPQLVKNENQLEKELRELANIIFTLATSTRVDRNF